MNKIGTKRLAAGVLLLVVGATMIINAFQFYDMHYIVLPISCGIYAYVIGKWVTSAPTEDDQNPPKADSA